MGLAIDARKLEKALSAIKNDGGGVYLENRFQSLATHSEVNGAKEARKVELGDPYYFAAQDFDNLLTIALRMDWQESSGPAATSTRLDCGRGPS